MCVWGPFMKGQVLRITPRAAKRGVWCSVCLAPSLARASLASLAGWLILRRKPLYTPTWYDPASHAAASAELPNARLMLEFVHGYNGGCARRGSSDSKTSGLHE